MWCAAQVTERMWKFVVYRYDDEATALTHANKLWSCWILYKRDGTALTETLTGGKAVGFTFGLPFKRIRKHVEGQAVGALPAMARYPSFLKAAS